MILFPPCKINLGLHILGKRPDGYHELDTLMYQVPFNDVLELIPAEEFGFQSSGLEISYAVPRNENSNLCVKAFRLMKERFAVPDVKIHLHKIIPMGGGLGGGSGNAAYVLRGIDQLFELNLSIETLQQLAAELGSDCPLFIEDSPQIAQGRGEVLHRFDLNLSGYYLKLVNVGIHVSTKEAFSKVDFYEHPSTISEIVSLPMEKWKNELRNDFENSVFQYHPELKTVKTQLYEEGAIYAAMSGSGSTLFGIYKEKPVMHFPEKTNVFEKIVAL